jgi:hypothetical protein
MQWKSENHHAVGNMGLSCFSNLHYNLCIKWINDIVFSFQFQNLNRSRIQTLKLILDFNFSQTHVRVRLTDLVLDLVT